MKNNIIEDILKQMKREEMEDFLFDCLLLNPSIKKSFEIKFSHYFPEKSKDDFKELLRTALNEIAYRGYIDEGMGRKMMHILYDYSHKIKECIDTNIKEAIIILEATLEVIGEFMIDGSNGEQGDIQDEFKELMQKILDKGLDNEKEEFLEWLKDYVEIDDEFVDYKDKFKKLLY